MVEAYPGKRAIQPIALSAQVVNQVLGGTFTVQEMITTLENAEFDVVADDNMMHVTHPYWRSDIHIPEDLIEEVGRLGGFDTITPGLPQRDFTAIQPAHFDTLRARIRQILTRAGANEVLSYSFVHGDILTRASQKPENSYRITNSISPSLQYYRQSLTPSLLTLVHSNSKQGFDNFALYELNKVHQKSRGLTDEKIPDELDVVALTIVHKAPLASAPYYQAKKVLDYLGQSLGLDLQCNAFTAESDFAMDAPFEYRRSALVIDKQTGLHVGIVGEYKKSVARAFKLPECSAGFELETQLLDQAVHHRPTGYTPISRYPSLERDICFQVAEDVAYQQIITVASEVLAESGLETSISPVDIYQPPDDNSTKNITVRIRLTAHDRTLTGEDAKIVVDKVMASVVSATSAKVI